MESTQKVLKFVPHVQHDHVFALSTNKILGLWLSRCRCSSRSKSSLINGELKRRRRLPHGEVNQKMKLRISEIISGLFQVVWHAKDVLSAFVDLNWYERFGD